MMKKRMKRKKFQKRKRTPRPGADLASAANR
jgi:hypothetical protein